ncbi:MAG TPA: YpdA family putative bacillithiol disulfide reductase [Virgibacillus sp.]|nr:YpdA family putative bacillithiol disulfide reductase [Virgibacillus sp.]
MQIENTIIIGAGPCGLSCALELKKQGIDPLIIEKGNVVNTLYQFPTHQVFFSSSDKLEIGGVPFISPQKKPYRNEALTYYREIALRHQLRIQAFEKVIEVTKSGHVFYIQTENNHAEKKSYQATHIIMATGYYDQPNYLNIPGEELSKVSHYFKEAHPYFNQEVVVIGGKNSAVDAALELHKAGASVTVLYRGSYYSKSIKPWILPEFDSLIKSEHVKMIFHAHVEEITSDYVTYQVNGQTHQLENDFVFAMTGYRPHHQFLQLAGIEIDVQTGTPTFNQETYETNISNLYIAGVIAAGYDGNKIFIENGRLHGKAIAASIIHEA